MPLLSLMANASVVMFPMLSAAFTGPVITSSASSKWKVRNAPRAESVDMNSSELLSTAWMRGAYESLEILVPLCQVSRDSEEREPMLSNLRDSGSIEQDADVVMFIHRKRALSEEDKQKLAKDANGKAVLQVSKIIVAKQRNGETGSFKVGYNANTTSFEEVSQSEEFIEPVLPDKKGYDKK